MGTAKSAATTKSPISFLIRPLDDFDDRILPVSLFRATVIFCVITIVLQTFRIVCSIKIYQMAAQMKAFWRGKIKNMDRRHLKYHKIDDQRTSSSQHFTAAIEWFERIFDRLVAEKLYRHTCTVVDSSPNNAANFCDISSIDFRTLLGHLKFDPTIMEYIQKSGSCCSVCSIRRDYKRSHLCKELRSQIARLLHTCIAMSAIIFNYNQIAFYLQSLLFSIGAMFVISRDGAVIFRLPSIYARSDICGYNKATHVVRAITSLSSTIFSLVFLLFCAFYIAHDEYISLYYTPLFSEIPA